MANHDFRRSETKEGKQAEFLLHERFPLDLVERIGVHSTEIRDQAVAGLAVLETPPPVVIRPAWYY